MSKFIVLIPVLNGESTISDTLLTCCIQNHDNFEIIVSDNCSDDNTTKIVKNYQGKYSNIRYIKPKKRMSMSAHWNFAISSLLSENAYLIVIGSDDALIPGALRYADGLLGTIPGIRALSWGVCYYHYPDLPDQNWAGRAMLRIGREFEIRDSHLWLERVAKGQMSYIGLANVYHGFVHTSVLRQLAQCSPSLILCTSPDVYLSLAICCLEKQFLYSHEPLSLNVISRSSNGFSSSNVNADIKISQEFIGENDQPVHLELGTILPPFDLGILHAECLLHLRDLGLLPQNVTLDWRNILGTAVFNLIKNYGRTGLHYSKRVNQIRTIAAALDHTDFVEHTIEACQKTPQSLNQSIALHSYVKEYDYFQNLPCQLVNNCFAAALFVRELIRIDETARKSCLSFLQNQLICALAQNNSEQLLNAHNNFVQSVSSLHGAIWTNPFFLEAYSEQATGRAIPFDSAIYLQSHSRILELSGASPQIMANFKVTPKNIARILIFSEDHPTWACAQLRLCQPFSCLEGEFELIWMSGSPRVDLDLLASADSVVIQRFFPSAKNCALLEKIYASKSPVIYELDDLLFNVSPENPHYRFTEANKHYYIDTLRRADAVVVSTHCLAEEVRLYANNVYVLPNLVNPELFYADVPEIGPVVTIGLAGSLTHDADFALLDAALEQVLKKYGNKVRLVFMGTLPKRWVGRKQVELHSFEPDYEKYAEKIRTLGLDIALVPLLENPFNRVKSNIKWLEYSACGIAGIFSATEPYRDVRDQETGLLVTNTTDAWLNAICDLVDHPEKRRTIALAAQDEVLTNWNVQTQASRYSEIYRKILAETIPRNTPNKLNDFTHWDETAYLRCNPDVAHAVQRGRFKNGLVHYQQYGKFENRQTFSKTNEIKDTSAHNDLLDITPPFFNQSHSSFTDQSSYQSWFLNRQINWIQFQCPEHINNFLIVTCIEDGQQNLLADTLDTLGQQTYANWYLSILSDFPCPDPLFDELDNLAWKHLSSIDQHPAEINKIVSESRADWILFIDAGTRLEPYALAIYATYINLHENWHVIYADEDYIDKNGLYHSPCFKPDINSDLIRSMHYIGDTLLVRKTAFLDAGGLSNIAAAPYFYDLALKILDYCGEQSFGHVSQVLYHLPEQRQTIPSEAYKQALINHLRRSHTNASVVNGYMDNTFWLQYQHNTYPLVSIIIPTKDKIDLLQPCVESLLEKTSYQNYEVIIVDNQSELEISKDYFDRLLSIYPNKVRVLSYSKAYNFSAINNFAAEQASGDYLLLLNNDTVIIQEHWLDRMLNHGQREEVGIVGARLLFPNQTLQHAGVILGMGSFGVADHPHISLPITEPGYMNRAQVVQNFSAVTAACMLIRKSIYFEVDGLDEENFKVLFNDVDLCLKVREKGYKIVWTPYATVVHHGSSSIKADKNPDKAKRARQEADKMLEKWLPQLANDPAYNRNLSLKHRHFQIETETDVTWNVDFHDRPRVYAFPANDSGIGEYRVRAPLRALTHAAMIESSLLPNHSATLIPDIVEIERVKPDILLLQNGTADYLIHAWQQYRKFNDVFMIYSQDDLVHMLPGKHPLQSKWPKDVRRRLNQLMSHSDRLIVATKPLQEAYSKYISDIKLVPNYLEKARWLDLKPSKQSRNGKKLRVGWAGGGQHHGDLEFIAPVIEATKDEVDWIFMGMCLDQIRPFIKGYHTGVAFDLYPQKLADLDLDLAIAPLEYNNFNMAKTNLRLLEYGVLGWPVLCSDITPYKNAPVTLVGNNVNHWIKAIREKIHEPEALIKEGQALQQWVFDNYWLEDHLDQWLAALTP